MLILTKQTGKRFQYDKLASIIFPTNNARTGAFAIIKNSKKTEWAGPACNLCALKICRRSTRRKREKKVKRKKWQWAKTKITNSRDVCRSWKHSLPELIGAFDRNLNQKLTTTFLFTGYVIILYYFL